mmetsp:Transcript_8850/g.13599  ORF Transcript_8850/g.13599 Transcript_8850/m.13599 type:complete len:213 (+) Transcript_8850:508-1146(+)
MQSNIEGSLKGDKRAPSWKPRRKFQTTESLSCTRAGTTTPAGARAARAAGSSPRTNWASCGACRMRACCPPTCAAGTRPSPTASTRAWGARRPPAPSTPPTRARGRARVRARMSKTRGYQQVLMERRMLKKRKIMVLKRRVKKMEMLLRARCNNQQIIMVVMIKGQQGVVVKPHSSKRCFSTFSKKTKFLAALLFELHICRHNSRRVGFNWW